MLKRLKNTGINTMVLVIAMAVFVVAFIALNGLAAAQKPETATILAAAQNLDIGEVITPSDLIEKTVYLDDNTQLYIPSDQADSLLGGTVALPVSKGQPFFRNTVLAQAGEGYRISAILAKHPGYSLYPLSLDAMNMIAPDIASYLPGDIISITVVIGTQPQPPEKDAAAIAESYLPIGMLPTATAVEALPASDNTTSEAMTPEERSFPPMSKDLFPAGLEVVIIEGVAPELDTADDGSGQATLYNPTTERKMLILLVPNNSRETLSLAIQQADQIVVSLLARGNGTTTPGFTYWDFVDMFKTDREEVLGTTAP